MSQPPAQVVKGEGEEKRAEEAEKSAAERELTPAEQQRLVALDKMGHIEQEFLSLKDTYFARKTAAIQSELALVESGKHEQYLAKETQLRDKMLAAVDAAARERAYQIRNAQLVYDAEVAQAEKDLALDRKHLKKKMSETLQQRLEELEEEKRNFSVVDFNAKKNIDDAFSGQPKKKKPKAEGAVVVAADGRRKRLNPPHVNYSLRETDVYADLHVLKRGANLSRAMLDAILFDVYPSGSETLVYHELRFERGHALIVADKDGQNQISATLELVTPVEIVVKPKTMGAANMSIELAKLRNGTVVLLKP